MHARAAVWLVQEMCLAPADVSPAHPCCTLPKQCSWQEQSALKAEGAIPKVPKAALSAPASSSSAGYLTGQSLLLRRTAEPPSFCSICPKAVVWVARKKCRAVAAAGLFPKGPHFQPLLSPAGHYIKAVWLSSPLRCAPAVGMQTNPGLQGIWV